MQTVTIGQTAIRVPALGVGTWAWGDTQVWQYGKGYGKSDVVAAFHASLHAGLTLFDSAEMYGSGTSERILGELVRTTEQPVVVATKYAPLPWRLTAKAVQEALDGSLQRLGLDHIDLYQVHWYLPTMSIERLMNALADAHQAGKIGAIGVSNYNEERMRTARAVLAQRGIALASNQVEYHLLNRECETNGVLQACRELGVSLIAYSPLGKGLLTGKYRTSGQVPGVRRMMTDFRGDGIARAQRVIAQLEQIGRAHDKTPAQVALNWLVRQPGVIPIPGAKNARQATENAGALGWEMSAAEAAALDAVTAQRS